MSDLRLRINDIELFINLCNTNFADYWYTKVFQNSRECKINEATFIDEKSLSIIDNFKATLYNTLETINEAIDDIGIPNEHKYKTPWTTDSTYLDYASWEYLQYVHEQWANFTVLAQQKHLDTWDEEISRYYREICNWLEKKGKNKFLYNEINPQVHNIEHWYAHYYREITIDVEFPYNEYIIQPEDSHHNLNNLQIPFFDIGRPQYEKWELCRDPCHEEISNYQNIKPVVQITANNSRRLPDPSYLDDCNSAGVKPWGPRVGIGNFLHQNQYQLGQYLIVNCDPSKENDLRFVANTREKTKAKNDAKRKKEEAIKRSINKNRLNHDYIKEMREKHHVMSHEIDLVASGVILRNCTIDNFIELGSGDGGWATVHNELGCSVKKWILMDNFEWWEDKGFADEVSTISYWADDKKDVLRSINDRGLGNFELVEVDINREFAQPYELWKCQQADAIRIDCYITAETLENILNHLKPNFIFIDDIKLNCGMERVIKFMDLIANKKYWPVWVGYKECLVVKDYATAKETAKKLNTDLKRLESDTCFPYLSSELFDKQDMFHAIDFPTVYTVGSGVYGIRVNRKN